MRRICVFLGSSPGARPEYAAAAVGLARALAGEGLGLVYGGSRLGLMGVLADAAMAAGAEVIGVMPRVLVEKEAAHLGLPDLRVTATMHERKALMAELADAFVAMPGGLGTLEELFEAATWTQLGLHAKPLGLLNVLGYYDPLVRFLDHAVKEALVRPQHRDLFLCDADPARLIGRLRAWTPQCIPKWIGPRDI